MKTLSVTMVTQLAQHPHITQWYNDFDDQKATNTVSNLNSSVAGKSFTCLGHLIC